ncbi:MAG TPA: nucleotidyltransferase domain-containing protein [Chloroflexi bacterium]|nr:nucleotidyltransferase domain-containing protein [Chloroflexota bacterium]
MVDPQEIRAFADRVVREFHPERIILFGSHARGTPGPDSDVDLLIVMSFQGKPWHMASEIRRRARPTFPIDLLVRTPEQVREQSARRNSFLRQIVHEGVILYESEP